MCPKCAGSTRVVETRQSPDVIHRRRRCLDDECKTTFFTDETVVKAFPKAMRQESLERLMGAK